MSVTEQEPQETQSTWPAGWYDVPDRPNTRGYWDGSNWTGDYVPRDSGPIEKSEAGASSKTGIIIGALGLGGIIVGSIGPWATAFIASVSGTDGDGKITLAFAGVGLVGLLVRQGYILTIMMALAALGVGIYDIINVSHKAAQITFQGEQIAHVGWGLYVVVGGAVLAIVGSLIEWTRQLSD